MYGLLHNISNAQIEIQSIPYRCLLFINCNVRERPRERTREREKRERERAIEIERDKDIVKVCVCYDTFNRRNLEKVHRY